MGKLVWMMSVSLDGFMAAPDRGLDWQHIDAQVHRDFNRRLGALRAFLDGRITYELMVDFWPTADADPQAPPEIADFARIWRDMPKYVFSRTLTEADWDTTVLSEVDPVWVRHLLNEPGGDVAVGGAELAATFRELDLIDEYWVYVHPVLIGAGLPMFGPADRLTELVLLETMTFDNGVVLLRYGSR